MKTSVPDFKQVEESSKIVSRIKSQYRAACKRASLYEVVNTLTLQEWVDLLNKSWGACHYCRYMFGVDRLSPDHLLPLVEGGENSAQNTIPACERCNLSKNKYALPKKHQAHYEPSDYRQVIGFHEMIAKRSLALGAWLRGLALERLGVDIGCYETEEVLAVYPARVRVPSYDINGKRITVIKLVSELGKFDFWFFGEHYRHKATEHTFLAHAYAYALKSRYGEDKVVQLPRPEDYNLLFQSTVSVIDFLAADQSSDEVQ